MFWPVLRTTQEGNHWPGSSSQCRKHLSKRRYVLLRIVICPYIYRFTKHAFWPTTSQVSHLHGPNSAVMSCSANSARQAVWAAAAATAASWPYRSCPQVKVRRGTATAPGCWLATINQCNTPLGKKQKPSFQSRRMPTKYSSLWKCHSASSWNDEKPCTRVQLTTVSQFM